jgi:predicted GH43/DUF377 family glycosyl hydrolase
MALTWKRLGNIFDPLTYEWDQNFIGYAQSPQTLVLEDRVRVYFATRLRDQPNKYVSHIRYVDFDLELTRVLDYSRHEVIPSAVAGAFDEHGVFPLNVVKLGERVLGYSNGWSRRKAVSVETGIGLLESNDRGKTFTRFGTGPVLSATQYEPFLVGDPFVAAVNGKLHMWYIYGQSWKKDSVTGIQERTYKIADAESTDGVNWKKLNRRLIEDRLGDDECQALPTVLHFDGKYHMFFSYREAFGFRGSRESAYRIGYASSNDLNHWARDDEYGGLPRPSEGWDSQMMCYPHVFRVGDNVHLLYNGNEFGRHGFGLASLTREYPGRLDA